VSEPAMSSDRLDAYLSIEATMMRLDDMDDPLADSLRDVLDPIHRALTKEERTVLNARGDLSTTISACDECGWIHEGEHPPREHWRSWEDRAREAERAIAQCAHWTQSYARKWPL